MAEPIPQKVLDKLKADAFMKRCCICGKFKPQWHHNMEYARKAINETWCIIPLCQEHHNMVREVHFRRLIDWTMLNRATDYELEKYSKVMNYKKRREYLNRIFGDFSPSSLRENYKTNTHLSKFKL